MKHARFAIAAAVMAVMIATTAMAAPFSRSERTRGGIKFYVDVRFVQPLGEGTFATSGAFTDSGTFVSFPGGDNHDGKLIIWRRFSGKRGSIVVQDVFAPTETGSWTILSGTGAYAKLHGHGTSVGSSLGSSCTAGLLPPPRALAVATGTVS
jgi:hypothetical protein